jgi:hypothetical protein
MSSQSKDSIPWPDIETVNEIRDHWSDDLEAQARELKLNPPLLEEGRVVQIPYARNKVIIFADATVTVGLSSSTGTDSYTCSEIPTGLSVVCLCSARHRLWDPHGSPDTFLRVFHRSATFRRLRSPFHWCEYVVVSRRQPDETLIATLDGRGPFTYGLYERDREVIRQYDQIQFSEVQDKLVHFNINATLNLACRYSFETERAHYHGLEPAERMFAHTSDRGMTGLVDSRMDQALGLATVGESVSGTRRRGNP